MNDIHLLSQRAQVAAAVAGASAIAKAHIESAQHAATTEHLDIAVRDDLDKAIAAIDRAIKHAEQCRRRLLRKADQKAAKQESHA
jgi:hypothetical protein